MDMCVRSKTSTRKGKTEEMTGWSERLKGTWLEHSENEWRALQRMIMERCGIRGMTDCQWAEPGHRKRSR